MTAEHTFIANKIHLIFIVKKLLKAMSKYQIQQSDIKYMSYVNTSFCVCLLFSNLIHDKT